MQIERAYVCLLLQEQANKMPADIPVCPEDDARIWSLDSGHFLICFLPMISAVK